MKLPQWPEPLVCHLKRWRVRVLASCINIHPSWHKDELHTIDTIGLPNMLLLLTLLSVLLFLLSEIFLLLLPESLLFLDRLQNIGTF